MSSTNDSTTNEPETFSVQVLPAGSAPKDSTFQPDVNGERAPGQPDNSADTTYDKATEGSNIDVHKGLGKVDEDKGTQQKERQVEIKSATEREPETADMI